MILYQKPQSPFLTRVLGALFRPATFILMLLSLSIGSLVMFVPELSVLIWMITGSLGVAWLATFISFIVGTVEVLLLIEIIPSGLRLKKMRFSRLQEAILSKEELDVAATRVRKGKSPYDTYCLRISSKNKPGLLFRLDSEDIALIGNIVDQIHQHKLIVLRHAEQQFLKSYKAHPENKSLKKSCLIATVVILGLVGFTTYLGFHIIIETIRSLTTEKSATSDSILVDSLTSTSNRSTSFNALKEIIAAHQPIPDEYFTEVNREIFRGNISVHTLIHETDPFIITRTDGMCEAGVNCTYLFTFSKTNGKAKSAVSAGLTADGIDPYAIKWISKRVFEMVDYTDEVETDADGLPVKGKLGDSTVFHCNISAEGIISCLTDAELIRPYRDLEKETRFSTLDSRNTDHYVLKVIQPFSDGTDGPTYLRVSTHDNVLIDQMELFYNTSGGVALIVDGVSGRYFLEKENLLRLEPNYWYSGPAYLKNGRFLSKDSGEYYYKNADKFTMKTESRGHVEYYRIMTSGRIRRVVWSDDWSSLDTLSRETLGLLRNEVLARHGLAYETSLYGNYFSHFPWYVPVTYQESEVIDFLTPEEKRFVEYIRKVESRMRDN